MDIILGYLVDYSAEIVGVILILFVVNILSIKKRKIKKLENIIMILILK